MKEKETRPINVQEAFKTLQEATDFNAEAINPIDTLIGYVIELESKCEKLESDLKSTRQTCDYLCDNEAKAKASFNTLCKIIDGINGMTELAKNI